MFGFSRTVATTLSLPFSLTVLPLKNVLYYRYRISRSSTSGPGCRGDIRVEASRSPFFWGVGGGLLVRGRPPSALESFLLSIPNERFLASEIRHRALKRISSTFREDLLQHRGSHVLTLLKPVREKLGDRLEPMPVPLKIPGAHALPAGPKFRWRTA